MGNKVDPKALHAIPYGLFLLTTREGEKDNGCIVNTVEQISGNPLIVSVSVNKANLTHEMIVNTGVFNVSILTETAPLYVFKKFGFKSGRDTDKFDGWWDRARSENGLYYLTVNTNAMFSCKVINSCDCGTHTLFIAEVTESKVLSAETSVTYAYYHARIKGKPTTGVIKRWVCVPCGYIYEGEELPLDIRCPLCGCGFSDFELLPNPDTKQRWACRICGYIYEGNELPPDFLCPICKHTAEDFDPI